MRALSDGSPLAAFLSLGDDTHLRPHLVIVCVIAIAGANLVAETLRPKRRSLPQTQAQPGVLVPKKRESPRPEAEHGISGEDLVEEESLERPKPAPRPTPLAPKRKESMVPTEAPPEAPVVIGPKSLSLLLLTPLFKEDVFDAKFSTFGLEILASMPIFRLSESLPFFIEFGPGLTYSSLSLSQPAVTFSHIYFFLPVRLRTQLVLGRSNVRLDLMAGLQLRPFEYDSRETNDGGFHSTGSLFGSIDPDLSVGIVIPVGTNYRIRGYAGYLKLAAGFEYLL